MIQRLCCMPQPDASASFLFAPSPLLPKGTPASLAVTNFPARVLILGGSWGLCLLKPAVVGRNSNLAGMMPSIKIAIVQTMIHCTGRLAKTNSNSTFDSAMLQPSTRVSDQTSHTARPADQPIYRLSGNQFPDIRHDFRFFATCTSSHQTQKTKKA